MAHVSETYLKTGKCLGMRFFDVRLPASRCFGLSSSVPWGYMYHQNFPKLRSFHGYFLKCRFIDQCDVNSLSRRRCATVYPPLKWCHGILPCSKMKQKLFTSCGLCCGLHCVFEVLLPYFFPAQHLVWLCQGTGWARLSYVEPVKPPVKTPNSDPKFIPCNPARVAPPSSCCTAPAIALGPNAGRWTQASHGQLISLSSDSAGNILTVPTHCLNCYT